MKDFQKLYQILLDKKTKIVYIKFYHGVLPKWLRGWSAKPLLNGSIPLDAYGSSVYPSFFLCPFELIPPEKAKFFRTKILLSQFNRHFLHLILVFVSKLLAKLPGVFLRFQKSIKLLQNCFF